MTDREKRHKGISAFLVPTDARASPAGSRTTSSASAPPTRARSSSSDCAVPARCRLGEEGEGFKIAMSTLDGGRIGIAAQAARHRARGARGGAWPTRRSASAFGQPIAQFQAIQFMLADMATELDAARLLMLRAAALKDQGVRHTAESAMAKLFASEMCERVTRKALQIHGGYGYMKEFDAERHCRDAASPRSTREPARSSGWSSHRRCCEASPTPEPALEDHVDHVDVPAIAGAPPSAATGPGIIAHSRPRPGRACRA